MNNPKIYGFCPAGCKWETVHRNEFDASKSAVPLFENVTDHTYHLTNKDINLLEKNPYFDVTQHFKIYDGTTALKQNVTAFNATDWNVSLYMDFYLDGELNTSVKIEMPDRGINCHEIDVCLNSIHFLELSDGRKGMCVNCKVNDEYVYTRYGSLQGDVARLYVPANGTNCSVHIYVKNIGYPHTTEDGTTTERVEGCENTRVYSIGYSKGFFNQAGSIKTPLLLSDLQIENADGNGEIQEKSLMTVEPPSTFKIYCSGVIEFTFKFTSNAVITIDNKEYATPNKGENVTFHGEVAEAITITLNETGGVIAQIFNKVEYKGGILSDETATQMFKIISDVERMKEENVTDKAIIKDNILIVS